jgi:DNA-directed RNA polymerase subunit RPC12/RpoP
MRNPGEFVMSEAEKIQVRCPSCGATGRVAPQKLGAAVACPKCRAKVLPEPIESTGRSEWEWFLIGAATVSVLLVFLALIMLLGGGPSEGPEYEPGQPRPVAGGYSHSGAPAEPKQLPAKADQLDAFAAVWPYTVEKRSHFKNVKLSLDVRILKRDGRRPDREILRKLAETIYRRNEGPKYERVFICYYLPGMEINRGAWATTHYNPALEVRILGTTQEEEKRLANAAKAGPLSSEDVVGRWRDRETAFPGVITILKENGEWIMTKTFADGSVSRDELVVEDSSGQTRFVKKEANTSDYWVIAEDGRLLHGDDEGIWAASAPVR